MPYPPSVPPAARTDATPMVTNHAGDHNAISAALTEILNHIAALEQTLGPIGSMIMWPGTTEPTNHMFCRGQELARADYPELFGVLGTTYGGAPTTFNLPNLMGRMPMAQWVGGSWATTLGQLIGNADSTLPSHHHWNNFGTGTVSSDHSHNMGFNTSDVSNHHDHTVSVAMYVHDPYAPQFYFAANVPAPEQHPVSIIQPGTSMAGNHVHGVNGGTGGISANHSHSVVGDTDVRGSSPSQTNIPPGVVVNFAIRVR